MNALSVMRYFNIHRPDEWVQEHFAKLLKMGHS